MDRSSHRIGCEMRSASPKENAQLELGNFRATSTKLIKEHTSDHAENKAFTALKAQFARVGHTLNRTVNPDGTIFYLAGKWGYFRHLKGLEAVAAFLAFIGGAG